MKIKINQLDEEVNEKNVKMQQLKAEVEQLHHQLVSRHQEPTSVNKISVGSQTQNVSIIIIDEFLRRELMYVHSFYMNHKFY